MTKSLRFLSYWLPVFTLAAIIFYQSSFATPTVLPRWPYLDKLLHAGVYGLLSALICRALNSLPRWRGHLLRLMVAGTLLAALYGLSDEWHQSFVPHRSSDAGDLLADLLGAGLGAFIYLRAYTRSKRRGVAVA
jgi:VanZ family protein